MAFTYSPRQRFFYRHLVSLFRPQADANLATGVVRGDDWTLAAADVLCHVEIRPNLDEFSVFGRYQTDTVFTLNVMNLPVDCPCESDYMILNLTRDSLTGGLAKEYGKYYRVRGPARNISNAGPRRFGKRSAFIYEELPPLELLEAVQQP